MELEAASCQGLVGLPSDLAGAHPSPQACCKTSTSPAAHKCPPCLLKGLGSDPAPRDMHKPSKTSNKIDKAQCSQCCHKGLDSKQLTQDITYIQKAIKPFYKNNISSVSYKNNATVYHLTSSSCAQVGCTRRWHWQSQIYPNQSSTAELLHKEGFHSSLIIEINLIASCTCKGEEPLKPTKCRSEGWVMADSKHSCGLSSPTAGLEGCPEGAI